MAYDDREDGTFFVGINDPVWGPEIQRSHDLGATWRKAGRNPRFAEGRNDSVDKIWHIEPGRPIEPGVIYAGVSPAALFKSADGGDTWSEGESLSARSVHVCGPFLLPIFRWGIDSSSSPPSASDGPSGEEAGMEANKRRLTLDLASTFQRWLKVWRSRASACAGAVKPPSTGRPAEGKG